MRRYTTEQIERFRIEDERQAAEDKRFAEEKCREKIEEQDTKSAPDPKNISQTTAKNKPKEREPMDRHVKTSVIICATAISVAWIMRPNRYESKMHGQSLIVYVLDTRNGDVWFVRGQSKYKVEVGKDGH